MPINSNETIRRESIEEIDRMISHFSQKQALYNELDVCRRNIEYYSNPDLIIRGFTGKPLIVIGIILTALSASFFFSVLFFLIFAYAVTNQGEIMIPLYVLALGIVIGIVLIVSGKMTYNRFFIRNQDKKKDLINQNKSRLDQISDELINHYYAYGSCKTGYEYTEPKTLYRIWEKLVRGRADTINEAIKSIYRDQNFY